MIDKILEATIKDKNNSIKRTIDAKKRRIEAIEEETNNLANTIYKLERPELIQKTEEKRANLEEEKELLEEQIKNKTLNESDFKKLYIRVRNIIEDPLSIRELGTTELKILLIGVLF